VIDEYARANNMALVNTEVLADLKEAEQSEMRRNDRFAYVRHGLDTSRPL
jgi:hypothetical protein